MIKQNFHRIKLLSQKTFFFLTKTFFSPKKAQTHIVMKLNKSNCDNYKTKTLTKTKV